MSVLWLLAEQARGPGSQPLIAVLPQMAVAVAQMGLQNTEHLFDKGDTASRYTMQAGYQRFVLDIAYIISDLTTNATEDSKAGISTRTTVHA